MVDIITLPPVDDDIYDFYQYPNEGKCSDMVCISEADAGSYYDAAKNVMQMYMDTVDDIIGNDAIIGEIVPDYMIPAVRYSWDKDHAHLIGRFDFAGGIGGTPIKLIEFNADTPFSIFETAIVQNFLAIKNGYRDDQQFNYMFDTISDVMSVNGLFESTALFTSYGSGEDRLTTKFLEECANNIDCETMWVDWEDLYINTSLGLYAENGYKSRNLVKMYPWEILVREDERMVRSLCDAIVNGVVKVYNPPYAMLLQNKGLMYHMYKKFPDSKYLLPCMLTTGNLPATPLKIGDSYVRKPVWGREGNNITFFKGYQAMNESEGEYDSFSDYRFLNQSIAQFDKDNKGRAYQAGVFISGLEPCGLGFRRTATDNPYEVITTNHELCGHIINK